MSEPQRTQADRFTNDQPDPLQTLESLRNEGAGRLDPARFKYLEALSRRLPDQPERVRRLLHHKLQAALAEYAERFSHTRQVDGGNVPRASTKQAAQSVKSPLAQLNKHIRDACAASLVSATPGEMQERHEDELASVRRFKRSWTSNRTQDRLAKAVTRKPAKAGPLNSHALMLHSLAMMQDLSPDYLRRFLVHVESLQWLEQAKAKYPPPQGKQPKAARRGRQKK